MKYFCIHRNFCFQHHFTRLSFITFSYNKAAMVFKIMKLSTRQKNDKFKNIMNNWAALCSSVVQESKIFPVSAIRSMIIKFIKGKMFDIIKKTSSIDEPWKSSSCVNSKTASKKVNLMASGKQKLYKNLEKHLLKELLLMNCIGIV